jgi:hypothetical protein
VRVAIVIQVLRAQAFVFLRVDKPLQFPRRVLTVVDLEAFQQPLEQPELVIGIDDLEILRQARLAPVPPEQPVRKAVKGADPQVLYRDVEQPLDPVPHFGRGLVRERDRQETLR